MHTSWQISAALLVATAAALAAEGNYRQSTRLTEFIAGVYEPTPSYSAPYIVQHNGHADTIAEAEIKFVHEQTGKTFSINVWPPEPTVMIAIKQAVVLPDQRILVGLRLISPENYRAEVIGIFNAAGERKSWFQTNPYAWSAFAVDSDDSLWFFGKCPDYLAAECGADYPLVRHYSLKGELLEGFLSPRDFLPLGTLNKPPSTIVSSWVDVRRDFIGLFVGSTSEWLRLDRKGKILERSHVAVPDFADRFALSPEGRLLIGGSGVGRLLELDPESGTVAERPEYTGYLMGTNGDTIVLADFVMGAKTKLIYVSPAK